jgi:branched-chain amino acid transport system ATP-binding protein
VVIEARDLTAGYGGIPVLRDVNLSVGPGEVVALLGANGAGKSTTLLTLAGEVAPTSGDVVFLGDARRRSLTERARRGLTFVTEERSVFAGLTAAENLKLGRGGVEKALAYFPQLEPHLGCKAGLLSGGQQQILTLARALASGPRLLLADELTLGLAPIVVQQLLDVVRRSADDDGVGVLLVEQHVRSALEVSDRAYVLQRGRCVLTGNGADLRSRIAELEQSYLSGAGVEEHGT